jgi:hypothetical protein
MTDVQMIGKPPVALGDRVGPSAIAVVAPDPLARGYAQMAQTSASEPKRDVRIFHSLREAVVWIRRQTPAGSGSAPHKSGSPADVTRLL